MKQIIEHIQSLEQTSFTKEEILDLLTGAQDENYYIFQDEHAVQHRDGKKITLPKKEFLIIKYFMDNKHRIVSRDELLRKVWEDGVVVGDRTVDVHIRKIRSKFPDMPIVTRKCCGYMWYKTNAL
jgi:hypothetical protein